MPDLKVLIVDDEPLARDCVRLALRAEPGLRFLEAGDGEAAVQAVRREQPEVIFLDVQMPGLDGFEVVETLGVDQVPALVFVTAFDRYAVRAFEAHALDYVLKPFDDERLRASLRRAREQRGAARKLGALLDERPVTRFAVRENDRVRFVAASDVDYVEADANYVVLHQGPLRHRVRLTLRGLLPRLPADQFVQIHRGVIVNLTKIREVQAWFGGDYLAILTTGEQLRVSRTFAPRLLRPAS